MIPDELVKHLIRDGERLREVVGNHFVSLRVDNITQIRELIKYFILISSGVIGFSVPIFGKSPLIKTENFLIGGLIYHLVVILYGFYNLKWVLERENEALTIQHKQYNDLVSKFRDNNLTFIQSKHTEDDVKKKSETDQSLLAEVAKIQTTPIKEQRYALDLIFVAFFLGILMVVLSMTDIDRLWLCIL